MSDEGTPPDTDPPGKREILVGFSRQLLGGYRASEVDRWASDCARQIVDLHEQLMEQLEEADALRVENRQLRGELRHWHDRLTYIEGESDRVRAAARRIEAEAHARATQIEQNAQQGALQMVDRVCTEANNILMMAREEAHELLARQENQIHDGRERLERMTRLQLDITTAMRQAMQQFERGLLELEAADPSQRAREIHRLPTVRELPPPVRRLQPTFGMTPALAAMVEDNGADLDAAGPPEPPRAGGDGNGDDDENLSGKGNADVHGNGDGKSTADNEDTRASVLGSSEDAGSRVPAWRSPGDATGGARRPVAIEHATGHIDEADRARVMAANAAAVFAGRGEPEGDPEGDPEAD